MFRQGSTSRLHSSPFCDRIRLRASTVRIDANEAATTGDWCEACIGWRDGATGGYIAIGAIDAWLSKADDYNIAHVFAGAMNARQAAPDASLDFIFAKHARNIIAAMVAGHPRDEHIAAAASILHDHDTNPQTTHATTATIRGHMNPGAVAWNIAQRHLRGQCSPADIAEAMLAVTFAETTEPCPAWRTAADIDPRRLIFRRTDRRAANLLRDGTVLYVCTDEGLTDAERQVAAGLYADGMGVKQAVELATLINTAA